MSASAPPFQRLYINIDHVATIRQARRTDEPDPVAAAIACEDAGANGITAHLREDRRHIQDFDVEGLMRANRTAFNLEMACTDEMLAIAERLRPLQVTFVPEKREEITTEGGLDVTHDPRALERAIARMRAAGIRSSLFIDPDTRMVEQSRALGADAIELHTGSYAHHPDDPGQLQALREASALGARLGLHVHAGHGLTVRNVTPVAAIREIEELNIGHSIVSRSVFVGIAAAVREMREAMDRARSALEPYNHVATDALTSPAPTTSPTRMNGSPELLEFYLVEATEYLDALDQLVAGTGGAPDGNAFIATARALRGASSMAKVNDVGEIAAIVEQIAHGTRDGEIRWTLDLHSTLKQTVDDLRFLVRGVRIWGERESARAQARLADLQRFLSPAQSRQPTPEASATAPVFIALQSSAIAAELDAFIANPLQRRALDDALTRVRTMRGIAGIGDFPPLADVADAVDRAARALMPDAPLAAREIELFRSAAEVLRRTSARLRDGIPQPADAPEVARFAAAAEALADERPPVESDPIVPIDRLFYSDGGPHVVQRAVAPPTTRLGRFQEEIITRAEHIRRLVGDARAAQDPAGRERSSRLLREALLELQSTAASFDVHQVASFFGEAAREDDLRSPSLLEAVDAGAMLLLTPGRSVDEIEQRLAVLERARRVTPIMTPTIEEAPVAPPVSPRDETPSINAAQSQGAPKESAPSAPVAPSAPPPASTAASSAASPPAPAGAAPAGATPAGATPASEPSIDELLDLVDEGPFAATAESTSRPTPERSSTQEILAALDLTPAPTKAPAPAEAGPPSSPPPSTFPRPVAPRRPPATPSGRELQTLLQEGIAGLGTLEDEPLSAPARLDEDDIVPIESLVYRGQSAIRRAIAVRDEMRASGRTDDATLQEIFDLLDLAQAE